MLQYMCLLSSNYIFFRVLKIERKNQFEAKSSLYNETMVHNCKYENKAATFLRISEKLRHQRCILLISVQEVIDNFESITCNYTRASLQIYYPIEFQRATGCVPYFLRLFGGHLSIMRKHVKKIFHMGQFQLLNQYDDYKLVS